MCNIIDEKIKKVFFGVEKEAIFHKQEIKDVKLDLWHKLFLFSELYGVGLVIQEDEINNCYRVKILEAG